MEALLQWGTTTSCINNNNNMLLNHCGFAAKAPLLVCTISSSPLLTLQVQKIVLKDLALSKTAVATKGQSARPC